MKKEYDYTIYPDNSPKIFKETCNKIERALPGMKKEKLLIDVDGSTVQIYGGEPEEIIVYDDYDVGAVFVKSDVDLHGIIEDYRKDRKS